MSRTHDRLGNRLTDRVLDVWTLPAGAWVNIADGERELYLSVQARALKVEGDIVKNVGRAAIKKARIRGASRLATAIRGDLFPKKRLARAPAYVIGTNAEIPLVNLETGAVITAKGPALMIPIGEAAKFKQPHFAEQSGRLARTIAAMTAKYGKLSWHTLRDGTPALGAWATNRAARLRFHALFILRKSVTIPKKHDAYAQMERAARGIEERVARRAMQMFEQGHDAVVARAMRKSGISM